MIENKDKELIRKKAQEFVRENVQTISEENSSNGVLGISIKDILQVFLNTTTHLKELSTEVVQTILQQTLSASKFILVKHRHISSTGRVTFWRVQLHGVPPSANVYVKESTSHGSPMDIEFDSETSVNSRLVQHKCNGVFRDDEQFLVNWTMNCYGAAITQGKGTIGISIVKDGEIVNYRSIDCVGECSIHADRCKDCTKLHKKIYDKQRRSTKEQPYEIASPAAKAEMLLYKQTIKQLQKKVESLELSKHSELEKIIECENVELQAEDATHF